jgi:hypothetical protein
LSRSGTAIAALVLLLGLATAAAAAEDAAASDCTWLPDLRCGREDGRPDGFRKPIVQPYLFEDPFVTTGLYPYYVYHDYPEQSVFQGGGAHVAAVQARVALTDRLAFLATKDGYLWNRPDLPLLDDEEGWMNVGAGFKYLLVRDDERRFYVSPSFRYEAPSGAHDVFQGEGDGLVIPSISGAWGVGDAHLIAGLGAQIPIDGRMQSSSLFYHLYADYEVHPRVTPFVQLSGLYWIESGDGSFPVALRGNSDIPLGIAQAALGTGPFEGADVAVLGSERVDNLDLVTLAVGTHLKLAEHLVWSVAYERAITHSKGIFQQRMTTALVLEF